MVVNSAFCSIFKALCSKSGYSFNLEDSEKQDSEGRTLDLGTATDEEITSPQFLKPQNKK